MSFAHDYTDPDGERLGIRESANGDGAVLVPVTDANGWLVPPHRLAEVTRALWAAAGQVVPDLPVIYDPATVDALAADLQNSWHGAPDTWADQARLLLDAGWRKP